MKVAPGMKVKLPGVAKVFRGGDELPEKLLTPGMKKKLQNTSEIKPGENSGKKEK
jgi:hypothetical protein